MKKYKKVRKRRFERIPGTKLYGESGKNWANPKNRYSNLEIEGLRKRQRVQVVKVGKENYEVRVGGVQKSSHFSKLDADVHADMLRRRRKSGRLV